MTKEDDSVATRRAEFARNDALEELLGALNDDLAVAEKRAAAAYSGQTPSQPLIFVMGAPRCGSTLFMQWLAATGLFAYPTNLLSRFWAAPIIGARIQKLLTDPAYDFRDELNDLKGPIDFTSHHGKTSGALSPNEFWYFWRRFLPGNEYHSDTELKKTIDTSTLGAELTGLTEALGKPLAAKGMIFNENIPLMADLLPSAIFVYIKRLPEFNVQSLLQARQRQYGDMAKWYSFKIRNYGNLKGLSPVESVSGQIASIHHSVEHGLEDLPDARKLTVDYEKFCENPAMVYRHIAEKLSVQGLELPEYVPSKRFEARDVWRLDWITRQDVRAAYDAYTADPSLASRAS